MPRSLAALVVVLALGLAGCSTAGPRHSPGAPLDVVAGAYPYAWVAEQVGGPDARVTDLTRAGVEPHDIELTARQVAALVLADAVLVSPGFQTALDDAVAAEHLQAVDLTENVALRPHDPHLWLDPVRLAQVAGTVAEAFAVRAPEHAAGYRSRAADLQARLGALDAAYRAGLAHCARHELVTSHEAFGYLAERYGLEQVGVTGLSPDQEPSPGRLASIARLAERKGVTTVFFEERATPAVARVLAQEVGARAAVLDPVEGRPPGGDYLSAMRQNLRTLRAALGCT